MRTRNALERLAAAAPAVELPADVDEDRILARILASPRPAAGRRPLTLALAGVAVLAAGGVAVSLATGGSKPSAPAAGGNRHVPLTGVTFRIAGYRFRTPAGYTRSTAACIAPPVPGKPRPAIDGFAAAASASGGCIEAVGLVPSSDANVPSDATAVAFGSYDGYYAAGKTPQEGLLYVRLTDAGGPSGVEVLELAASGMTEDELIAVAESGLATLPSPGPTPTTGTEATG